VHCGDPWREALEEVYALAARVHPVAPCTESVDQPSFGSPDVFIPFVHTGHKDLDALICSQLHLMPPVRRARHVLDLAIRRGWNFDGRFDLLKCWVPSRVVARFR